MGEPIFEVAPESLDGVQFGGIGGEEEQRHILGHPERLGFVKRAVIKEQEMEASGIGGGKVGEKELEPVRVEKR